jgi:hypothetical protein
VDRLSVGVLRRLGRLVNAYGTHDIDDQQAWFLEHPDAIHAALDQLQPHFDTLRRTRATR